MKDFNIKYNSKEVYSDFKQSKSNNNAKVKVIQKILEILIY